MLQGYACNSGLSSVSLLKSVKVQALVSTEFMAEHATLYHRLRRATLCEELLQNSEGMK